MNKGEIYVLGVGHNTPVYTDLVEACGYTVKGLFHYNDDRTGEIDHDYPILGSFADLYNREDLNGMNFALSQGDNKIRAQIYREIKQRGGNVPTLVHPSANVSRHAVLGDGVIVHINTVIHPDVIVGVNTILSYNVSISHNVHIGENCYFAFGVMIGAYVNILNNVMVGIGACAISGKVEHIGEYAYVGAGSLLTHDVDDYCVVVGRPARVIRKLEK
jgi:sugar O-acyltransferase (sialic acid O-acetyltransferase NeuD family)